MASKLTCSSIRYFTTSSQLCGKRNFRKFNLYEKRATPSFWREHGKKLDPDMKHAYNRGNRPTTIVKKDGTEEVIPEMIPDIIVPDLEGFNLKPYVSYRVPDIVQPEYTPQDLFFAVYSSKIASDFENNKLNEDGSPMEPSEQEKLDAEEANKRVLQTGSDIYG